jgi:proline iminopeptidase
MKQKEQYISILGLDIFVKMIGSGEPIVFLHGGPGDEHRYFLPHVEKLAEYFTLIFYDQRGCGLSQKPNDMSGYSVEHEVETLEELRKTLGFEKINLLGQSWGTMLGLLYATTYTEHVNKLMLVSAIGATGEGYKRFAEELEKRMSVDNKEALQVLEDQLLSGENVLEEIKSLLFPYYVHTHENLNRLTTTKINEDAHSAIAKGISRYDVTSNITRLSDIPVMLLQGATDLITPEMLNDLLLQYIPHAELVVLKRSGHWPFLEEPERFNEATRLFFDNARTDSQ